MTARFFSSKEDDEKAYRTNKDMHGRARRRGIDKGINAVLNMATLGIWGAITSDNPSDIEIDPSDAVTHLGKDAAKELTTKVFPRSKERE